MSFLLLFTSLSLLLTPALSQKGKAVAVVQLLYPPAGTSPYAGTVEFTQTTDDAISVKVNLKSIPAGEHGFHIHQNGDLRITKDSTVSLGFHFQIACATADTLPPRPGNSSYCDSLNTHGYPPSNIRHPGDMGNILALSDGTVVIENLQIGQNKASLNDTLRSAIGRAVVIHKDKDQGVQPYGNAGSPYAAGVIALVPLGPGETNAAKVADIPSDSNIAINLRNAKSSVYGQVLISTSSRFGETPTTLQIYGAIYDPTFTGRYSLKFTTYGDTRDLSGSQMGDVVKTIFTADSKIDPNIKGVYIDQELTLKDDEVFTNYIGGGCILTDANDKIIAVGEIGIGSNLPNLPFDGPSSAPTPEPEKTTPTTPATTSGAIRLVLGMGPLLVSLLVAASMFM